jgi:hypothetical protein
MNRGAFSELAHPVPSARIDEASWFFAFKTGSKDYATKTSTTSKTETTVQPSINYICVSDE